MASVLPWSWTTLNDYRTCPKRYYEVRIAKSVREPDSHHLLWGKEVHSAFELGVSRNIPMPPNMVTMEPVRKALHNAPGDKLVEVRTAVNSQLEPCEFFASDCWNRGVDDLLIINGPKALSIDYKTGKPIKNTQQLSLSAARAFAKYPQLVEINTAYYWTQTNTWTRAKYVRDDVTGIWEEVHEDIQQMLWSEKNNAWPARPSGLCKKSKKPGSTYMGCPVTNCPHSENYKRGDGG